MTISDEARRVVDKRLDLWLGEQDKSLFPEEDDYAGRFGQISSHLEKHLYPEVEKGALMDAVKNGCDPIYLNNHGKPHIEQVVSRASDLLIISECQITPYEGYLLLTAICFHDLGNIYGRKDHERKVQGIMKKMGTIMGDEAYEKRIICLISSAHSGITKGINKDRIAELQREISISGQTVRKQFLAALLRFSDELADDKARASRFMLNEGLLEGSEIYHVYSNSLRSVDILEGEIMLHFNMSKNVAVREYRKGNESSYLLDEIFRRTLKMHLERLYCMRFLRPEVKIDMIRVAIEVFETIGEDYLTGPPLEKITYSLEEIGYPKLDGTIESLCPDLAGWDGEVLKQKLVQRSNDEEEN